MTGITPPLPAISVNNDTKTGNKPGIVTPAYFLITRVPAIIS